MPTASPIAFRPTPEQAAWLSERSRLSRTSRNALIRDALDRLISSPPMPVVLSD